MSTRKSGRSNKGVPPSRFGFEDPDLQSKGGVLEQDAGNTSEDVVENTVVVQEEESNENSMSNHGKVDEINGSQNDSISSEVNVWDVSSNSTIQNASSSPVVNNMNTNSLKRASKAGSRKSGSRSSVSSIVGRKRQLLLAQIELENKKKEMEEMVRRAEQDYRIKVFDVENGVEDDRSSVSGSEISRRTKEYVDNLPMPNFYDKQKSVSEENFKTPEGKNSSVQQHTFFDDQPIANCWDKQKLIRDMNKEEKVNAPEVKTSPIIQRTVFDNTKINAEKYLVPAGELKVNDSEEAPVIVKKVSVVENKIEQNIQAVTIGEKSTGSVFADDMMSNVVKVLAGLVEKSSINNSVPDKRRIGDLPIFTGNCEDWPMFKSEFYRSAEEGRFSDSELLRRLERAIRGNARQTVNALFVAPENVYEIMETLEETYGRPEWIMLMLIDKARKTPPPQDDNAGSFIQFCNVISNLVVTAENIGQEIFLDNPELLLNLVCKLSASMKIHWGQYAILYGSNLKNFSIWTKVMRNIKCSTNFPQQSSLQNTSERRVQSNSKQSLFLINSKVGRSSGMSTNSEAVKKEHYNCLLCLTNDHKLKECENFLAKDVPGRYEVLKSLRVCFRCLDGKHFMLRCPGERKMCDVNGCSKYHHKLLHYDDIQEVVAHHGSLSGTKTMLRVIPVMLTGPKGTVRTAALCDEASTITMIESSVANAIGISGPVTPLCYQWTNNVTRHEEESQTINISICEDVENSEKTFTLKNVRTVGDLSLPPQNFNADEILRLNQHLVSVPDIRKHGHLQPTILIGHDHYGLIVPRQLVEEDDSEVFASKSKLGWSIHGKNESSMINNFSFHLCQTTDQENLHNLVKENFKLEESGLNKKTSFLSREDKLAVEMMNNSLKYDGTRYQLPLLWKDKNTVLPESKTNAVRRLECLERKMDKNDDFGRQYCAKIDEYVSKGYASRVENPEPSHKEWYLPHFGVFNINKPNKIRFVFDAASKSHGKCLNDFLLQGPDLVPSLISVIWNFRIHAVAFSGDIKEMFHQVLIDPDDSASMRFLFRGMDRDKDPDTYQMNVMIFGAICSPSMAQFVKNENSKKLNDPEIEFAITKLHYVDDYLDGSKNEDAALGKIQKIISVHKSSGFDMVNWICNSQKVLDALPADILSKNNKNLNLENGETDRVLGLIWNSQKDCFVFSTNFEKLDSAIVDGTKIPTKRQVLQVAMSIFDPLQFLAPLMIKVKILLQEIWRSGIVWDAEIPEALQMKWKLWLNELQKIKDFEIPRRYFSSIDDDGNIQLHIFGDASEKGYSSAAYLRHSSECGKIQISFLSGKAKVAPLKHMTVPRLELQAAVLSSRLASSILNDLSLKIHQIYFWTDSMVVLSWIKSTNKRYKMFVGNRIGEISETTNASDWNWVSTNDNPSDAATRDAVAIDDIKENKWYKGPEFLLKTQEFWPVQPQMKIEESDELIEEIHSVYTISEKTVLELPDISRFSKFLRLIRTTAWIYRYVNNLRSKIRKEELFVGDLVPSEVDKAKIIWLRKAQNDTFGEDIKILRKHGCVQSNSRLLQLSPVLDENFVLRLDGRLKHAPVVDCVKQPIILDPKHALTEMLIHHEHEVCMHTGKDLVVNQLRQEFWIINIKAAVKKCFNDCRFCKNRKCKPEPPEMGPLPEYRLTPYVRPFNFCGVDYFGPIEVKIGRRVEKRYGVLFTCLTIRAIHIEVASSLDTSSAIMAIRRFVSVRGCPSEMWSDNGTNLKGADKELQQHIKTFDQSIIQQEMSVKGILWHFIPPLSPHMGGSWERMIGLVKTSIKAAFIEHHPKEETLRTVLSEAQALVNSRPLTEISNDSEDADCLTPNHFLIGTASTNPIPGVFEKFELTSRKQWRVSQALLEIFWKKWIVGYLPTLVKRKKWFKKVEPLKVGDMVKIHDEEIRKGIYPLGIITKIFPGEDQQVRAAEVKTAKGSFVRPTVKLAAIDVQTVSE